MSNCCAKKTTKHPIYRNDISIRIVNFILTEQYKFLFNIEVINKGTVTLTNLNLSAPHFSFNMNPIVVLAPEASINIIGTIPAQIAMALSIYYVEFIVNNHSVSASISENIITDLEFILSGDFNPMLKTFSYKLNIRNDSNYSIPYNMIHYTLNEYDKNVDDLLIEGGFIIKTGTILVLRYETIKCFIYICNELLSTKIVDT